MQSLRDKLLKAGLVSEEAAKKAEADKAASPPPRREEPRRDERPRFSERPRRDDRPRADERPRREDRPRFDERPRREEPRVPRLPPMAGSKEASRQAAKKQLEVDKKLRELVVANAVPVDVGATPFYFVTRKNKLRRLEVTEAMAKRLEAGELAVVERPDPDKIEHALVPPAIAEELMKLSPRAVRFLAREGAKVGFLTDEEIHQRATEADGATAEANDGEPEGPAASEPAAPEAETFITIKRSPLP